MIILVVLGVRLGGAARSSSGPAGCLARLRARAFVVGADAARAGRAATRSLRKILNPATGAAPRNRTAAPAAWRERDDQMASCIILGSSVCWLCSYGAGDSQARGGEVDTSGNAAYPALYLGPLRRCPQLGAGIA